MVKLFSGGSDETGGSAVMSRSKKQQHGSGTAGSEESPSGPMSSEKKSSGPVSPEKKSSGPVSSEKKSSGPVSPEKKSSGPVSSEKKSSGPVSPEKKSSGPVSPEKKSSGPVSSEKKSSGPVSSEKSSGPVSSEKKSSGPVSPEKKSSGPVSSEKKSSGPVSPEKKSSGPVSSEKKSSGPVSPEKKSSGPVSSEKKSSGPVSSEKKSSGPVSPGKLSSGPVSPGSKMEQRSSVTAGSGSKELSSGPASSVMSGGTVIPGSKKGQSGTDVSGKEASGSESKKAIFGGPATSVAGRWSRRTLKGHQGHKFKDVNGLAFHNDKLLVCDSDNNIVHILNQDYTCEKELGSFSGQFAKPFKPWSIAVSQDNLYFILDKNNVQIVVCDQNNKVIRIINLPADSDPQCIALVKGFVIVTEVNGHRVLKYSLDGMYIGEFGHRGDGDTEFNYPRFVAVNSRDVIMVSDWQSLHQVF
ncbi:sperm acrosomal protein FSA-ACR.1-like isoform X2 [Ptychodera flava]|uniref:sperm acrosomal protein FSA-ACR.1-like isoform X2 n=1 Tax=Ptychodera flava TaxID=63121 RepID=UPI00396A8E2A